ncbi:hypothetical protein ABPG72_014991 [Tetrahymena utriculariae]
MARKRSICNSFQSQNEQYILQNDKKDQKVDKIVDSNRENHHQPYIAQGIRQINYNLKHLFNIRVVFKKIFRIYILAVKNEYSKRVQRYQTIIQNAILLPCKNNPEKQKHALQSGESILDFAFYHQIIKSNQVLFKKGHQINKKELFQKRYFQQIFKNRHHLCTVNQVFGRCSFFPQYNRQSKNSPQIVAILQNNIKDKQEKWKKQIKQITTLIQKQRKKI